MSVSGTVTKWTLRGTTVPTARLKLIELRETFGAPLDCRTDVRIWVFCSGVSDTAAPAGELVVEAPTCALGVVGVVVL